MTSYFLNVKAVPRQMIPMRTIINGICNTNDSEEYIKGKAVNRITTARISHTWLASQTGAIALETVSSLFLPKNVSMMPAPKSAPPNNAYRIKETHNMMMIRVSIYFISALG